MNYQHLKIIFSCTFLLKTDQLALASPANEWVQKSASTIPRVCSQNCCWTDLCLYTSSSSSFSWTWASCHGLTAPCSLCRSRTLIPVSGQFYAPVLTLFSSLCETKAQVQSECSSASTSSIRWLRSPPLPPALRSSKGAAEAVTSGGGIRASVGVSLHRSAKAHI